MLKANLLSKGLVGYFFVVLGKLFVYFLENYKL